MQIVKINEKEYYWFVVLLLEHPLGGIDKETINIDRIRPAFAPRIPLADDHNEPAKSLTAGTGVYDGGR